LTERRSDEGRLFAEHRKSHHDDTEKKQEEKGEAAAAPSPLIEEHSDPWR
jgi:hypothetical protein